MTLAVDVSFLKKVCVQKSVPLNESINNSIIYCVNSIHRKYKFTYMATGQYGRALFLRESGKNSQLWCSQLRDFWNKNLKIVMCSAFNSPDSVCCKKHVDLKALHLDTVADEGEPPEGAQAPGSYTI